MPLPAPSSARQSDESYDAVASPNDRTTTTTAAATNNHSNNKNRGQQQEDSGGGGGADSSALSNCSVAAPSLLQPRMAVVLGVPEKWHALLFACRLLSIVPAVWWGLPSALRFLVQVYHLVLADVPRELKWSFDNRLRLTENFLAILWCGCSAYLSFFFTDCLMSRWLLNYTPQATIIRLLAINALNGYLTSWSLYLSGCSENPMLLLPAWISIATSLTMLYHITQRKINIRKETSTSISIFSIASFISTVLLLLQLHSNRPDFVNIPFIAIAKRVWEEVGKLTDIILDYANVTKEL